jgi:hypothetical protein
MVLMLLVGRLAGAQVTATSGAINGQVTDNTAAALPGVTVTISGPTMMGTRTAISDAQGVFRFPAVAPGDYKVVFELEGFSTVERQPVTVGLGFTATLNTVMGLAELQETVTVVGSTPLVDTQSTNVANVFSADRVKNLPFTGEYWSMLSITPAVNMARMDVGGSEAMNPVDSRVYGQSRQGRSMVEGIAATYGDGGGSTVYYADFSSFSDVSLNTSGTDAESPTAGMQAQFVSKSGGNTFRGSFFTDYENGNWQAHNISAEQLARGVQGGSGVDPVDTNRLISYRYASADVGGYVVKDKLWWYYATSYRAVDRRVVNVIGSSQETKNPTHSVKLTYKPTAAMNIVGYAQLTHKQQDPYLSGGTGRVSGGTFYTPDSGWPQRWKSGVYKVEWNQTLSDTVFAEARVGNYYSNWRNPRLNNTTRVEDIGTGVVTGGARGWDEIRARPQVLGSVSHYRTGWGGSHNLKFGVELADETLEEYEQGYLDNVAFILNNAVPSEVIFYDAPNSNHAGLSNQSAFITDTWQLNKRLSLNLSVRYDRYRSYLDEQSHTSTETIVFPAVDNLVTWNNVAPRIGVVWDVAGTGRTAVKFNYGTYYYNPSTGLSSSLNPNNVRWSQRYRWTDTGDGIYQNSERGVLLATSGGGASIVIDPNLENTFTRRTTAFVEHELVSNFSVRAGFVWVGIRNPRTSVNLNRPFEAFSVPFNVVDPGPDGISGTGDDGGSLQAWNMSAAYVGLPTVNLTMNLPEAKSDFYTWEMTADRRFSGGWSVNASFAKTWNREISTGSLFNPNLLINREDGKDHTTNWQAKASSTFGLPKGIRISPLIRHQAGNQYGRTFSVALNSGNTTLLAEPAQSRRTRNPTIVDTRFEKSLTSSGTRRLATFVDVYNIFNSNVENTVQTASGANFLRPTSIISPRILKIGAKFDW